MNEINIKKIDWLSLTILSLLVLLGLINIYSATHTDLIENVFSLKHPFGKQCFFAFVSIVLFFLIQTLPFKFFEKFLYLINTIIIRTLCFWEKYFRCNFLVSNFWVRNSTKRICKTHNCSRFSKIFK